MKTGRGNGMKKEWSGKKYRPLRVIDKHGEIKKNKKKREWKEERKDKRKNGRPYKGEKEKWMNTGGVEMKYM